MRVSFADLRSQYLLLKPEIDSAIVEVIESGQFSNGPKVVRLEEEIARCCGAAYGVAVASGTDALVLSLLACGVGPGDEVITTPFTFGATTEAIVLTGARPVYCDISPCTFNIEMERVDQAVTGRTRAVLPVDLYGQMVSRPALREVASHHALKLVVDSAQAIGASQNGVPIGRDGDTTTLSFYPSKNLGAYGDGGMVLTNSEQVAARLRSLRGHGARGHKYVFEEVGYCSRLDALQAAVLLAKLPHLSEWNETRRRNAAMYDALLRDHALGGVGGLTLPRSSADNYHIYHQYTIRHPNRDRLQEFLKEREIATEVYYPLPMHLQPAYANLGYRAGDFPVAEACAREALSLPVHPGLTAEQIEYVANRIIEFDRKPS